MQLTTYERRRGAPHEIAKRLARSSEWPDEQLGGLPPSEGSRASLEETNHCELVVSEREAVIFEL